MANGIYFARIDINDKVSAVKKLLLLYGSQHAKEFLSGSAKPNDNSILKYSPRFIVDSIVVSGKDILKKVFSILPGPDSSYLDVGNLIVLNSKVLISGKVYSLDKWKLPEVNAIARAKIKIGSDSTFTDFYGQFSLNTNITKEKDTLGVVIDANGFWLRETGIEVGLDTTRHNFGILDTNFFLTASMNFYNMMIRDPLGRGQNKTIRWYVDPYNVTGTSPYFYFDSQDTTIVLTVLMWANKISPFLVTPVYPLGIPVRYEIGKNPPSWGSPLISGRAVILWGPPETGIQDIAYDRNDWRNYIEYSETNLCDGCFPEYLEPIGLHELLTVYTDGGRRTELPSIMNAGPPDYIKDLTDWDKKATFFEYSRIGGNKYPDKDILDIEPYEPIGFAPSIPLLALPNNNATYIDNQ